MKLLLVGDPHVTPDAIDDCQALIDLVAEVANDQQATPVFLGDLHHTHNIIRAEAMFFWREGLRRLKALAMVGNHDYAGEGSSIHALMAYEDVAQVISKPTPLGGVLLMPYYADRERFWLNAGQYPSCKTLICHQTFSGSKYENGFYAEDGVNPDLVPQTAIISGHIHTPQKFGKVTYIGAPRWRSLSDANIDRNLVLYDFDKEGRVVSEKLFPTGGVCRRIWHLEDREENPITGEFDPKDDYRLDVYGSLAYVTARKQELQGPGRKIRTFVSNSKAIVVRESEGVSSSFRKYIKGYSPKFGTAHSRLLSLAQERLGV